MIRSIATAALITATAATLAACGTSDTPAPRISDAFRVQLTVRPSANKLASVRCNAAACDRLVLLTATGTQAGTHAVGYKIYGTSNGYPTGTVTLADGHAGPVEIKVQTRKSTDPIRVAQTSFDGTAVH